MHYDLSTEYFFEKEKKSKTEPPSNHANFQINVQLELPEIREWLPVLPVKQTLSAYQELLSALFVKSELFLMRIILNVVSILN